jgi:hypothetical protein
MSSCCASSSGRNRPSIADETLAVSLCWILEEELASGKLLASFNTEASFKVVQRLCRKAPPSLLDGGTLCENLGFSLLLRELLSLGHECRTNVRQMSRKDF